MSTFARHDTVPMPLEQIRTLCAAASTTHPCPADCNDGRVEIFYFGERCIVTCGTCGGNGTVHHG